MWYRKNIFAQSSDPIGGKSYMDEDNHTARQYAELMGDVNFEDEPKNNEKQDTSITEDTQPLSSDWLENAKSWIGTPYVFGGNSKRGIDCSAFIQQVFPDKKLPRTANEQMKVGSDVPFDDTSSWAPGDRVYFDIGPRLGSGNEVADHTGIYIGNNEFIQASSSKGVTISNIAPGSFYFKKLIAVKR